MSRWMYGRHFVKDYIRSISWRIHVTVIRPVPGGTAIAFSGCMFVSIFTFRHRSCKAPISRCATLEFSCAFDILRAPSGITDDSRVFLEKYREGKPRFVSVLVHSSINEEDVICGRSGCDGRSEFSLIVDSDTRAGVSSFVLIQMHVGGCPGRSRGCTFGVRFHDFCIVRLSQYRKSPGPIR